MEIIKFHRELTECMELLPYTLVIPKTDWFFIDIGFFSTSTHVELLVDGRYVPINYGIIRKNNKTYIKITDFNKYDTNICRIVVYDYGVGNVKYYSEVLLISDYWQEYFNKHYTTLSFKCKENDQIQHIPLDLEFIQTLAVIDSENYDEVSTNISVNVVKSRKTIHRYRSSFLANELITRVIQALNSTWVWLDGKRCQLQGQIEQEEVTNGNFSTFEFKVQFHNKAILDLDLDTYIVKEDNTTFVESEKENKLIISE